MSPIFLADGVEGRPARPELRETKQPPNSAPLTATAELAMMALLAWHEQSHRDVHAHFSCWQSNSVRLATKLVILVP